MIAMDLYQPVHRYPLNSRGRDFVVGDIHGCFTMLDTELARLNFDPERDRLFSVGDLVDRGSESPAVLDAIHRHQIKAVRGNHEQGILDWLAHYERENDQGRIKAVRENRDHTIAEWAYDDGSTSQLVHNGGQWFIELYCTSDNEARERMQRIVNCFATFPYAIEIETTHGRAGIVHAEPVCEEWDNLTWSLTNDSITGYEREQLIWDRRRWKGRESFAHVHGVAAVIVGHTPTYEVAQRGNVIDIDTGAVYGNKLMILNLAHVPEWLARGDQPVTGKPR